MGLLLMHHRPPSDAEGMGMSVVIVIRLGGAEPLRRGEACVGVACIAAMRGQAVGCAVGGVVDPVEQLVDPGVVEALAPTRGTAQQGSGAVRLARLQARPAPGGWWSCTLPGSCTW